MLPLLMVVFAFPLSATAQVIAHDMVSSSSLNLLSHNNAYAGAFGSAGDGFQKYQRGVSATIPFSVLDDSLATFPGDTLGIVDDTNSDEFFGVTDTENSDNSGPVTASWIFGYVDRSAIWRKPVWWHESNSRRERWPFHGLLRSDA